MDNTNTLSEQKRKRTRKNIRITIFILFIISICVNAYLIIQVQQLTELNAEYVKENENLNNMYIELKSEEEMDYAKLLLDEELTTSTGKVIKRSGEVVKEAEKETQSYTTRNWLKEHLEEELTTASGKVIKRSGEVVKEAPK